MSVSHDRRQDVPHQRFGTCHRCGWDQPLQKVGRRFAAFRRTAADGIRGGLRWLCDECVADLTTVGLERPRTVTSAATRQRSVA